MGAKMTTDEQIPKSVTVQARDYNLSDFLNVIFFSQT